jgi:hypothetical protein
MAKIEDENRQPHPSQRSANEATDHLTRKPQPAGAKVTVACKVPVVGLDLEMCRETEFREEVNGAVRDRKRWDRTGQVIRVRGTGYPAGTPPVGYPSRPEMAGDYALTRGVDRDFWVEWRKQNAKNPLVINGLLIAHEDMDRVVGEAKELREVPTGLGPIVPDRDPRAARALIPGLTQIETGDEFKSRVREAQRRVESPA